MSNVKVIVDRDDIVGIADAVRRGSGSTEEMTLGGIVSGIDGIAGAQENEGIQSKAINFYDPFGELVYSYTRAEAAELTELPAAPELEGFTFEAWTHTLAQIQSEQFFCDVAPTYKKDGRSVSVLILDVSEYDLKITLAYRAYQTSTKMTIDWGDGTTTTVSGTSSSGSGSTTSHTYTAAGRYYISLYRSSGTQYVWLGHPYSTPHSSVIYSATTGYSYMSFTAYQEFTLLSILCNINSGTYLKVAQGHQRLKIIGNNPSYSKTSDMTEATIALCPELKVVSTPIDGFTSNIKCLNIQFMGCGSLKRFRCMGDGSYGTGTYSYTALGCDDLKQLVCSAQIRKVMNYKRTLVLPFNTTLPTTIPTSISEVKWGSEPIYVPDNMVETYKTNAVFSVVADCIRPISEYPDF